MIAFRDIHDATQWQFTVGDQIVGFLEWAEYNDLKVKSIKLSMSEFRAILDDKDAREHYSDGYFCDIPLEFTDHDVWTS